MINGWGGSEGAGGGGAVGWLILGRGGWQIIRGNLRWGGLPKIWKAIVENSLVCKMNFNNKQNLH
jgi:hypothetical protein